MLNGCFRRTRKQFSPSVTSASQDTHRVRVEGNKEREKKIINKKIHYESTWSAKICKWPRFMYVHKWAHVYVLTYTLVYTLVNTRDTCIFSKVESYRNDVHRVASDQILYYELKWKCVRPHLGLYTLHSISTRLHTRLYMYSYVYTHVHIRLNTFKHMYTYINSHACAHVNKSTLKKSHIREVCFYNWKNP